MVEKESEFFLIVFLEVFERRSRNLLDVATQFSCRLANHYRKSPRLLFWSNSEGWIAQSFSGFSLCLKNIRNTLLKCFPWKQALFSGLFNVSFPWLRPTHSILAAALSIGWPVVVSIGLRFWIYSSMWAPSVFVCFLLALVFPYPLCFTYLNLI